MRFQAKLHVMLKRDVADVQGNAIQQSLAHHKEPVIEVKTGKYFEIEVEAESEAEARELVDRLAKDVFSNPVIEVSWYDLEAVSPT